MDRHLKAVGLSICRIAKVDSRTHTSNGSTAGRSTSSRYSKLSPCRSGASDENEKDPWQGIEVALHDKAHQSDWAHSLKAASVPYRVSVRLVDVRWKLNQFFWQSVGGKWRLRNSRFLIKHFVQCSKGIQDGERQAVKEERQKKTIIHADNVVAHQVPLVASRRSQAKMTAKVTNVISKAKLNRSGRTKRFIIARSNLAIDFRVKRMVINFDSSRTDGFVELNCNNVGDVAILQKTLDRILGLHPNFGQQIPNNGR